MQNKRNNPQDGFRILPPFVTLPILGLLVALAGVIFLQSYYGKIACGLFASATTVYFLTPAWRLRVFVEREQLILRSKKTVQQIVPLKEVEYYNHDSGTHTLALQTRTELFTIPGPGRPAPYRIARRKDLIAAILPKLPPSATSVPSSGKEPPPLPTE